MKVHLSLWTIREYPKRHFRYLSDSEDTFLPLKYCVISHAFVYVSRTFTNTNKTKEKREEIWRSRITNTPERQAMHRSNDTKTLQIRSITQLLQTDLGRSAGAITVIQPVWLAWGLRSQLSHFPQSPCNHKDKHLRPIAISGGEVIKI